MQTINRSLESYQKISVFEGGGYRFRLFKPASQKSDCWRPTHNVELSDFKSFRFDQNKALFGDTCVTKDRFGDLIGQLISYLSLPDDWDGYEGVAPNKQTVDDAMSLLRLLPKHISVPKPTLGNSGTVGFYWEKENFYAEICFEGDKTFWYYAEDGRNEIGEDIVYLDTDALPDDLILFLEQFSWVDDLWTVKK